MTIGEKIYHIFKYENIPEEIVLAFRESNELNMLIAEVMLSIAKDPIEGFFRFHILLQISFMAGRAMEQEKILEKMNA